MGDHAVPTPDRDSGSASLYSVLQVLIGGGFDVTFTAGAHPGDPYPLVIAGYATPDSIAALARDDIVVARR